MLRKRRKITGCILAILLAMTMLMGCAGENEGSGRSRDNGDNTESGSGRDDARLSGSSDSESDGGQEKEDSGKEELTSNIGIIKDNAYANLLVGFGCIIDDDWTFLSREEIAEMCGLTVDILNQAELSSAIDEGMYDMMAISADCMVNVNVVIQDVGLLGTMVQEKDVVEETLKQVEQLLGSMGFSDVNTQAQSIDFVDGEHAGIYNTAMVYNTPFYQRQVVYKKGTHIANITVSSYVEDATLDVFSWFDTAEAVMPNPDLLGGQ